MLKIRQEQIEMFEREALQCFEEEMIAHSKEFSPRLCEVIGDDQLRIAVRQGMPRAHDYGFSNRGPIRLYIEVMLLRGSEFDTDPQYPELGAILRGPGDQMWRAERIFERVTDYMDKVSGPDGINVRLALEAVAALARNPKAFTTSKLVPELLQQMHWAFPQKVAYVGEPALLALIGEGRDIAQKNAFSSTRAEALVVILMFAFGHGCGADPLYPWISQMLAEERIVDPTARANRLERRAKTWLDHVLSHPPGASRA